MSAAHILIVDDNRDFAKKLAKALEGIFRVEISHTEAEFRQRFAVGRFDLLIMDMRLEKNREGLDLLKDALTQDPTQAAIVMTAYADAESYTEALASGALTYLNKHEFSPVLIARTVEAIVQQAALRRQVAALQRRLDASEPGEIIGTSLGIRQVRDGIRQAADDGRASVAIVGEAGTGRSLAARNIHHLSRRRADGPFVVGSCAGLGPNAREEAMFGTFRRMESGRRAESKGWVDNAKGGILFLDGFNVRDEIAVKHLAEFVRTGGFQRKGGTRTIEADVQLVVSISPGSQPSGDCRTSRTILPSTGGIEINVPPLRERTEDILLLAQYALQNLYREGRTLTRSFRSSAIATMETLPWPGNVRELVSAIEYAAIRADAAGMHEIGPEHLPQSVSESPPLSADTPTTLDYQLHLARAELALVESSIDRFEFTKKAKLAEKLRYNDRFTFARRIRRHLHAYPSLAREYPRTDALFASRKEKHR